MFVETVAQGACKGDDYEWNDDHRKERARQESCNTPAATSQFPESAQNGRGSGNTDTKLETATRLPLL